MKLLQALSAKAESWNNKYGIFAKNLAKISLKTFVPGAGELMAQGIDCIFDIFAHQDDLKWKDRLDQQFQVIQADQERYVQLLAMIENNIGNLLLEISKELHQSSSQSNIQSQEKYLKNLFDRAFSRHETLFIQLQTYLIQSVPNFQIVDQKLDELCKKQIEIAIELREGNQSLRDSVDALKQLVQHLSLQIQDKQQEHTKNQAFRDFLVEIEHEMLYHNLNRAKVILENAFISKTIDLQFKQLYECKINALQGHLSQIEELLEKSKELASLNRISNIKQQVKNASRWIVSHQEYRTFLHQSGKTIGDKGWTLDLPIGIGGMGEVWKAHNLKDEIGAIKFVHEELLMDQFAKKKFFDEIDSLNKLQHPNIVALKDWGIENSSHQLYLVMAYIEGETLRQVLNRKAYFTWHEAQTIFKDLVEALYHCHQLNIIHKDIKPDNIILIKSNKQPVLIDFGIAKVKKIYTSNQTHTGFTNMVVGTDLYMSPEQKSGGHLTDKTDIYSLGVTLLECLTGKCSMDEKIENQLDAHVLDLLGHMLHFILRHRYNSEQLFEKLGGDLKILKRDQHIEERIQRETDQLKLDIQKLKHELMQTNMSYQSLINEKNTSENQLRQTRHISELKNLGFEKSIQQKENYIQKLEENIKQFGDALERVNKQVENQDQLLKERDLTIKNMQEELDQLKGKILTKVDIPPTNIVSPNQLNPYLIQETQTLPYRAGDLKKMMIRGVAFHMVYCPIGEFWMEPPRHKVRMTKGFWMGETQVTQELWEKVMGWNLSFFKGDKLPVEWISWYDCLMFCNHLSQLEKLTPCFILTDLKKEGNQIKKANVEWIRNANGYRLPTEAEWEYSAKAGSEWHYSGSNYIDEVALYSGNSSVQGISKTHKVKTKKPNIWGLYDMSGNVWEWCMDKYDLNAYQIRHNGIENPVSWSNLPCARVLRGGSYGNDTTSCRVTERYKVVADDRSSNLGVRLLRSIY